MLEESLKNRTVLTAASLVVKIATWPESVRPLSATGLVRDVALDMARATAGVVVATAGGPVIAVMTAAAVSGTRTRDRRAAIRACGCSGA
jgi:hypothetical protein